MKKWISVLLICCMAFSLTGCGNKIPDLSEKEMNMVTEYAAGLLLKYDANYQAKLLDDKELAEAEEMKKKVEEAAALRAEIEAQAAERANNQKDQSDSSEGSSEESSAAQSTPADLAEFLGLGQISVSCNGVEIKNAYPESSEEVVFAIQASPGHKLAVAHIYVTNIGSSESNLDIMGKNASFRMALNGGNAHGVMYTMLDNDFALYQGNIQPGQTLDLVLLADIPEEECAQVNSVSLSVQYDGGSIKISF